MSWFLLCNNTVQKQLWNRYRSIKHTNKQKEVTWCNHNYVLLSATMTNDTLSRQIVAWSFWDWGRVWTGCLVSRRWCYFLHRDRSAVQRRSWAQLRHQESDPILTVLISILSLWSCNSWFNILNCLIQIIYMISFKFLDTIIFNDLVCSSVLVTLLR